MSILKFKSEYQVKTLTQLLICFISDAFVISASIICTYQELICNFLGNIMWIVCRFRIPRMYVIMVFIHHNTVKKLQCKRMQNTNSKIILTVQGAVLLGDAGSYNFLTNCCKFLTAKRDISEDFMILAYLIRLVIISAYDGQTDGRTEMLWL